MTLWLKFRFIENCIIPNLVLVIFKFSSKHNSVTLDAGAPMVNKWTVLIKSIQTSSQVRWKHLGLFFVFAIDLPYSSGCWQGNLYQFHDENRNLPQVVSYRLSDFQGWHFYVVLQRTSQLKFKFWFLLYFSIIHEQPNKSFWMGPKTTAYYIASVLSLTSLSVNREVMFTSIKIICCLKP